MNADIQKQYWRYSDTDTDAVHPFDVGRDSSEDGGPLGVVTLVLRHKAGNTMDVIFSTEIAVQGATRVTLKSGQNVTLKSVPLEYTDILS